MLITKPCQLCGNEERFGYEWPIGVVCSDCVNEAFTPVGSAANYYGGVHIGVLFGKRLWCIEDHSGFGDPEEIPEYLYDALLRFRKGA